MTVNARQDLADQGRHAIRTHYLRYTSSTPIYFVFTMLKPILPRNTSRLLPLLISNSAISLPTRRLISTTFPLHAKDSKMPSGPPKHEMAYFPNMTAALPSESGEFRRVLYTGLYQQVVLMTVPVGGDIGDEVHTVDQALTFTSGIGKATISGKDQEVKAGDLMVVPAGTQHQFVNIGPTPLVCLSLFYWAIRTRPLTQWL